MRRTEDSIEAISSDPPAREPGQISRREEAVMLDRAFFDRKLDRLHQIMAKHDIDALLLAKNENTRYVSGYQRYFASTYLHFVHMVLVPQGGGPILMLPEHIVRYGEACYAQEVLPFPISIDGQIKLLRSVCDRLGITSGRIGIEVDFIPAQYFGALRTGLPDARFVSALPCIEETTVIKFPEEVRILREAAQLADMATDAMMRAAEEGMTEKQLAAVAAVALSEGAENFSHLCVRTGENAYRLAPLNTGRVIQRGDPIQLDIGYILSGYVSDINRTMIVGGPNAFQERILRIGVKMTRETIKALRPGARVCDIFRLAREIAADADLSEYFIMPFIGHSIGINLHENPYVTIENDAAIESGMVICMEPGLYALGKGTCRYEDMVLVTPDGPEYLSHCADDLALNGLV